MIKEQHRNVNVQSLDISLVVLLLILAGYVTYFLTRIYIIYEGCTQFLGLGTININLL